LEHISLQLAAFPEVLEATFATATAENLTVYSEVTIQLMHACALF